MIFRNGIKNIKLMNLLFLIFFCTFYARSLWAEVGVSIASGYGVANIVPIRLGFQKTFDKQWATSSNWPVGGYWEASLYAMNGQRALDLESHKRLDAIALAGVFRFQRREQVMKVWPYVDIGVGLSWLSKKEIGGRKLGIHFQFEDRIGLGIRFGECQQYDVSYRAIHFSNAYIGSDNHGINLHILALGYWFN